MQPEDLAIDPPFSAGAFATAGLTERFALTRPYPVTTTGANRFSPAVFQAPQVTFLNPLPADAHAIILFEGAFADPSNSAAPGTFFGPVDDPALLDGVDFIRGRWFLYASPTSVAEIDAIELPHD